MKIKIKNGSGDDESPGKETSYSFRNEAQI
jgi:hypothetical protein